MGFNKTKKKKKRKDCQFWSRKGLVNYSQEFQKKIFEICQTGGEKWSSKDEKKVKKIIRDWVKQGKKNEVKAYLELLRRDLRFELEFMYNLIENTLKALEN